MTFGCDPELFLADATGTVLESGKVLDKRESQVVPDGVQAELHPDRSSCIALVANAIASAMRVIASNKALRVRPEASIELSPEALAQMSPQARELGCHPSENFYNPRARVRGRNTTWRFAGGHLHLSQGYMTRMNPRALVQLLDYTIGNMSVLLDPDPHAARRRTMYGRAGEYRLKTYGTYVGAPTGLEYRTLSNFWLRGYPLFSLVCDTARWCDKWGYRTDFLKELIQARNPRLIRRAIDKADKDLAWRNFEALEEVYLEHSQQELKLNSGISHGPFAPNVMQDIRYVLSTPITTWFPDDPLTYWTKVYKQGAYRMPPSGLTTADHYKWNATHYETGHYGGWHNWLLHTVRPARLAHEAAISKQETPAS